MIGPRKNGFRTGHQRSGDFWSFNPDQNLAVLLHRQPLDVHEFKFQIFKARIIQIEYPAECAVRDALLVLEQRRRQRQ